VFVSSPVAGLTEFRQAVGQASRFGTESGKFEFFFFEHHENVRLEGMTVCQSIFETSGTQFDVFLMFFRDRLGDGTLEEFDAFERIFKAANPACKVWWAQIACEAHSDEVDAMLARLHDYKTILPCLPGEEHLDTPLKLGNGITLAMLNY
jgi:hypothetical protein